MHETSEIDAGTQKLEIYKSYRQSAYLSIKVSSYFQVYDELLKDLRGKAFTFVEIGVLNGGSLFMWRRYFGPHARIIGVDLNPKAKKWEADGFEIHIGNQSDPLFWDDFFSSVGDVDVILDDGGHTNEQQIVTAHKSIPHIKDGGMLIVEDSHTSYFRAFGNPSRYSFISYTKALIDSINSRFPSVRASASHLNKCVFSVIFFESIVCLNIDRTKCFVSSVTSNGGMTSNAEDFREHGSHLGHISRVRRLIGRRFGILKHLPFMRSISDTAFECLRSLSSRVSSIKLRKYFS
jgi:hypothetical protein